MADNQPPPHAHLKAMLDIATELCQAKARSGEAIAAQALFNTFKVHHNAVESSLPAPKAEAKEPEQPKADQPAKVTRKRGAKGAQKPKG